MWFVFACWNFSAYCTAWTWLATVWSSPVRSAGIVKIMIWSWLEVRINYNFDIQDYVGVSVQHAGYVISAWDFRGGPPGYLSMVMFTKSTVVSHNSAIALTGFLNDFCGKLVLSAKNTGNNALEGRILVYAQNANWNKGLPYPLLFNGKRHIEWQVCHFFTCLYISC